MYSKKLKKLFSLSLMVIPLLYGNFSCSKKNLNTLSTNENSELIPTIIGVAALGQLVPMGEVRKLASPISQFGSFPRVQEILIKEGDFVKKGSILAIFENQKELKVNLLKKQKLLEINQKEISLKKDQIERYRSATEKNAYSIVLLTQKEDQLLKLEKQKIINNSDKKSIEIDLFNTKLRSPIDGYILSINTRAGERSNSEGVLEIGASQKMQALIEVYESEYKHASSTGSPASLRFIKLTPFTTRPFATSRQGIKRRATILKKIVQMLLVLHNSFYFKML